MPRRAERRQFPDADPEPFAQPGQCRPLQRPIRVSGPARGADPGGEGSSRAGRVGIEHGDGARRPVAPELVRAQQAEQRRRAGRSVVVQRVGDDLEDADDAGVFVAAGIEVVDVRGLNDGKP